MLLLCPACRTEYPSWTSTCPACGVALVNAGDPNDPLRLPEELQVVYELQSWPVELQALAAETMAESEIPHGWVGTELVVHVEHEAAADAVLEAIEAEHGPISPIPVQLADDPDIEQTEYDLTTWSAADRAAALVVRAEDEELVEPILDAVEYPDELPPDDGDDGDTAEHLSELFLAADRLKSDGLDPDGVSGLAAVLDAVDPERAPYGLDRRTWAAILDDAEAIADVLVDDDLPDGERSERVADLATALRARLRPYV
jgi:hypothetical protein